MTVDDEGNESAGQAVTISEENTADNEATYTVALSGLGMTFTDQVRFGWDPGASYEAALDCAEKALKADPGCGDAYTLIGYVRTFQRRYDEALAAGERAVALSPSDGDAYHMAGMFHGYAGDFRTAVRYEEQAQRLSPLAGSVSRVDEARARLGEAGYDSRVEEVEVDGWPQPTYLDAGAAVPRSVDAHTLVNRFDTYMWNRDRIERLRWFEYRIEIYVPKPKRIYGYYCLPFLLGDTFAARCDLKADRHRGVLMVQGAFLEPGSAARRAAPELAGELRQMQAWLELDRIEVARRGDLSAALRRSVSEASRPTARP